MLYRQSDVPEVTELTWMLSTVTPMGLLQRAHSYKDKVAKGIAPNHGLFAYPVLMAADILIVRADAVPVGKDQKQHLEITRDIATAFNTEYNRPILKLPEPMILPEVAVVPGLDGQKMSKCYGNTLEIFAPEGVLKKKVMSLLTDSTAVSEPKPTSGPLYDLLADPGPGGRAAVDRARLHRRRHRLRRLEEAPARLSARHLPRRASAPRGDRKGPGRRRPRPPRRPRARDGGHLAGDERLPASHWSGPRRLLARHRLRRMK